MYPFLVERMIENSCCNVVFELLLAGVKEYDMLWQPIWKRYLLLKDWVWNLEQNVVMVPEHIKQKVSREVPNSAVKMATGSEPDHVGCTVLLIFFEIFVPELEKNGCHYLDICAQSKVGHIAQLSKKAVDGVSRVEC